MSTESSLVEMFVTGIGLDTDKMDTPVMILENHNKMYRLPIWIGRAEAEAISRYLNDTQTTRPMTQDLIVDAIHILGGDVQAIEIQSFSDGIFIARIEIEDSEGDIQYLDCRPSDAVAISLITETTIHVSQDILNELCAPLANINGIEIPLKVHTYSYNPTILKTNMPEEDEEFSKFIQNIKPSDFKL